MRKLLALGIIILAALNSFAQTSSMTRGAALDTVTALPAENPLQVPALQDNAKEIFRKNIIKVNLSSFALYNNSLSYERSLTRKITFVSGYRYMPQIRTTTAYLVEKAIEKYWQEDEDLVNDLNSLIVGNHTFTGEIRFYTGKKPGARGFYLSLYGRYMNLKAAYPYEYETDRIIYTIPFDGKIKGFAGGLMIGSQWLIAKRVTFDWYIIGGHYGKLNVEIPGMTDLNTMTVDGKIRMKEDIESKFDVLGNQSNVNATVRDQEVKLEGNVPFAGIRGLGFSIGVAF